MWGISGSLGTEIRKQQSDELKDQLLQQQMAQQIRAFEAEQEYRKQQLQAQIEERKALQEERLADRKYRTEQQSRQAAVDYRTQRPQGGEETEAGAKILEAYPGTAPLVTRRGVIAGATARPIPDPERPFDPTAMGRGSQEVTTGPQNIPISEPTPEELEKSRERVRQGELKKILGGVNRAEPGWRAKAAAAMAEIDPKSAFTQLMEQTPEERRTQHQQDLADSEAVSRRNALFQEGLIRGRPQTGGADTGSAADIADAIIRGDQPPELTGLYRMGAPVRAELARRGYNQANALTDWRATQRHLATMNGTQQTRLAQNVDNAAHSLDIIDDLAKKWDGGGFPPLNRAQLAAARNGVLGPKAQVLATQLEGQITDVTAELANVYMGGNSPTDQALALAGKNLSADWSRAQLQAMVTQARGNLQIRANSMKNVGVAGASATNPYAPAGTPEIQPTTPGQGTGPKVGDIKTFPNGKKGRFDGKGWELIQ